MTINQYGYLDGIKVWVMKYYPEINTYAYHKGNGYGFVRKHLITLCTK